MERAVVTAGKIRAWYTCGMIERLLDVAVTKFSVHTWVHFKMNLEESKSGYLVGLTLYCSVGRYPMQGSHSLE